MVNTSVELLGTRLDNPVIPASGTFGYGAEFSKFYDINILGSFSIKGTTLEPRFGNPTPRIAEAPSGMLNAVGLQNPGAQSVVEKELSELKKFYTKKVMANVGGFSVYEYAACAEILAKADNVAWIELNISCPNVHGGGMAFGTDPNAARTVTEAVKKVIKKPLIVKLSPNVSDITEIAKAVVDGGADGVSLINTLLAMRINLKTKRPLLANVTGGLSGGAVFPVALRMVYQVYKAVNVPIVGMGGVTNAEEVIEMMLAGATAVEVGAANLTDPYACKKIIDSLPEAMEKYRINSLEDIIGGAHL